MKKMLLLIVILTVGITTAQEEEATATQKKERLSPEQRASIKSKKMTLALDLTDRQQAEVYSILMAEAKNNPKEPVSRRQRAQLDPSERFNRMQERIDGQIRVKRQLKQVLSKVQYAKFEKMMRERTQKVKKRTRNMRRKAPRPSR